MSHPARAEELVNTYKYDFGIKYHTNVDISLNNETKPSHVTRFNKDIL